jgi:protein TilB
MTIGAYYGSAQNTESNQRFYMIFGEIISFKTMSHSSLKSNERVITLSLIRKRSEHNESLVSNLEEIALHQEELTGIGPTLGRLCGKTLKILLLQNNVISAMNPTDFKYFKVLEYINLALNNISVIQGLDSCEFLKKLDLTLNFIDLDRLKESIDCLTSCTNLNELFLLGNPCCHSSDSEQSGHKKSSGWKNCRLYIVARLPQLKSLDGTPIVHSERIRAIQKLSQLESELEDLAGKCMERKEKLRIDSIHASDGDMTKHCPEDRIRISNEMAQQKAEKEKKEKSNQPKFKREADFMNDQNEAIEKARVKEGEGEIKQCNEGKWKFRFDEEMKPGYFTLDVKIQKHLSSSLIDVDVHPTYISIVIKGKVLRLVLPAEVKSEESKAERSTTTGHLLISMPKCDPNCLVFEKKKSSVKNQSDNKSTLKMRPAWRQGLQSLMMEEVDKIQKGPPVSVKGIVKNADVDGDINVNAGLDLFETKTTLKQNSRHEHSIDEIEPPPLI